MCEEKVAGAPRAAHLSGRQNVVCQTAVDPRSVEGEIAGETRRLVTRAESQRAKRREEDGEEE